MRKQQQLILGLSGPPRSGKDTIAKFLCELLPGVAIRRMSAPLKHIALGFVPVEQRKLLEESKDNPLNSIGTTYRDLQIGVWILGRDLMGEDWLGYQLLHSISLCHARLIIVPDFGRESEVAVLLHEGLLVKQLRISRPGTTFEGDSREDFKIPGPSNSREVRNDGTLTDLRYIIEQLVPWLEERPVRSTEAGTHPDEEPLPAA